MISSIVQFLTDLQSLRTEYYGKVRSCKKKLHISTDKIVLYSFKSGTYNISVG